MSPLAVLARALTLFRFMAILPFVWLLKESVQAGGGAPWLGLLYVAVALSDWLDGRMARRANASSALWGRLDAAADIAFNGVALAAAAVLGVIAPWAAIAVGVMGAGFLTRRTAPKVEVEDRPGKLAGVLFYGLVGLVAAEATAPGILGPTAVWAAADAAAVYGAGVLGVRWAKTAQRRGLRGTA
jgi:hypothetical protein